MKNRRFLGSVAAWFDKHRALSAIAAGAVPSYWWAGARNFGDLVTPYLVEKITGRNPINVGALDLGQVEVLCSTGSILHKLPRGNHTIWGSGFIKPISASSAHPKLHALRGPLSGEIAENLGWGNPGKYGDPALLLPFLTPTGIQAEDSRVSGNIVVIPHYALLDSTKSTHPDAHIVSPMQEVEDVALCIASAALVISSSLHGLIVAQAYDRPWVWLRDHRGALYGDDFKFQDFFASIGTTPPSLECDGVITPRLVERAIRIATRAPRENTLARQRDLLSSAPRILDTPTLFGMKAALDSQNARLNAPLLD